MGIVSPPVGGAMAVQVKRNHRQSPSDVINDLNVQITKLTRERNEALEREQAALKENDTLRQRLKHERPVEASASPYLQVNGIDVVNQVEAARMLGEPQYKVSRWLKAGKFEKIVDPSRKYPWIAVRSLKKPERGQPGRPKKKQ